MRKRFLAREDLAETDPMVTPAEQAEMVEDQQLEMELTEVVGEVAEVDSTVSDMAEASSIMDTTSEIGAQVEIMAEKGEEMSEPVAAIIETALEQLYELADYTPKVRVKTSLESFKANGATMTLENIAEFNTALTKGLNVAQEGIGKRFLNTLKLLFTNSEKIYLKLEKNVKEIGIHGASTNTITEPGWGRSFAQFGKKKLSGSDVVTIMTKYAAAVSDPKLLAVLKEATSIATAGAAQLSRSLFIAKDDAVDKLYALRDRSEALKDKADSVYTYVTGAEKNDPSFDPLTVQEATKLGALAMKAIADPTTRKVIRDYIDAINEFNIEYVKGPATRLIGSAAADFRAANGLAQSFNKIAADVYYLHGTLDRVCFACARYIKDSTAK